MNNMIDTSIVLKKVSLDSDNLKMRNSDDSKIDFKNVLNDELKVALGKDDEDKTESINESDILKFFTDEKDDNESNNEDVLNALYQIFSGNISNNVKTNDLIENRGENTDLTELVKQISKTDNENFNNQMLSNLILQAKAKAEKNNDTDLLTSVASKLGTETTKAENLDNEAVNVENLKNSENIEKTDNEDGLGKLFDEISKKFPNGVSEDFADTRASYEMTRNRIQDIRSMTKGKTGKGIVKTVENNNIVESKSINDIDSNNGLKTEINQNIVDVKVEILDASSSDLIDNTKFENKTLLENKIDKVDKNLNFNASEKVTSKTSKDESQNDANLANSNQDKFSISGKMAEINKFVADKEFEPTNYGKTIVDQVKNQISIVRSNGLKEGINEINMKLKPENLGELNIKITLEKGNLSIDILAESSKTQNIILNNIDQLKDALKQNVNNNYINVENEKQEFQDQNQNSGKNNRNPNFYFDKEDEENEIEFLDELIKMNEFNLKRL